MPSKQYLFMKKYNGDIRTMPAYLEETDAVAVKVGSIQGHRLGHWPALRPEAVRGMLDEHLAGKQDFGLPLFNLISVMLFLDRAAAA